MIIIGLTGSLGAGKTTAAGFLKENGAVVIDADEIVRQNYKAGADGWRKIIKFFGPGILDRNKNINKKKLSEIVFFDPGKLKALGSIIHPRVIKEIDRQIKSVMKKDKEAVIVIDAPLLFETGLEKKVDFTICVSLPPRLQFKRLLAKKTFDKKQIRARLENQMPLKEKEAQADFIIDNSGSFLKTRRQAADILKKIKQAKVNK